MILKKIPQREVAVGDLCYIKTDDKVPCDCLILKTGQDLPIKVDDMSAIYGKIDPISEDVGSVIR